MLRVERGARVLEVGTGSGLSTALLTRLVGPQGRVVTLDVHGELTVRARDKLRRDGYHQVVTEHADGQLDHPAGAPYDLVVAWASAAEAPPPAWVEQVRPGGVIALPVRRDPPMVLRLRVGADGLVREEDSVRAGFVPLTAEPFRPWETSPYGRPLPPRDPGASPGGPAGGGVSRPPGSVRRAAGGASQP